ncbi:hypothetical protein GCM10009677_44400 [Sphaerisporangium rubeum]|uniref:Cation/H+ exchanger domain-containing protein n=1 Tax=Sphaerisporangium rubeum TaxID=321317 RepID=A0A7X0I9E2_9ACTN|nr:hypothetical protein [Sphaerisporangium rubeum]MBB6471045.1 hypothetical protein [Sphaerisporangium rubeum]
MTSATDGRSLLWPSVRRLLLALTCAGAGLVIAGVFSGADPPSSPAYVTGVSALLALGLYGSASGIPRAAVTDLRRVVLAVTVGVLFKALLIGGVMFAFSPHPASLVLGVAVAQIDPLSVAALLTHSQMSARAKGLLLAWASFDDPITALLTIYLSVFAFGAAAGAPHLETELGPYLLGIAANLLLAAAGWLLWQLIKRLPVGERTRLAIAVAVLIVLGAVAVWQFLMLGMALLGLFYRLDLGAVLDRLVTVTFYLASVALGLLLIDGVLVTAGLVLGLAAFAAQIVVGGLLVAPRGIGVTDRVYLALGQQNGVTAILLALALAPVYPPAIQIVAPAILVINILHILTNAVWDRRTAVPAWLGGIRSRQTTGLAARVVRVLGAGHISEHVGRRLEDALRNERAVLGAATRDDRTAATAQNRHTG